MSELIELRRDRETCILTLRREHKLNAISRRLERELCDALEAPELREAACVVFTGGGRAFSAGADLNEMRGLDPASIIAYYEGTGDFAERVADLPQPTISAIAIPSWVNRILVPFHSLSTQVRHARAPTSGGPQKNKQNFPHARRMRAAQKPDQSEHKAVRLRRILQRVDHGFEQVDGGVLLLAGAGDDASRHYGRVADNRKEASTHFELAQQRAWNDRRRSRQHNYIVGRRRVPSLRSIAAGEAHIGEAMASEHFFAARMQGGVDFDAGHTRHAMREQCGEIAAARAHFQHMLVVFEL